MTLALGLDQVRNFESWDKAYLSPHLRIGPLRHPRPLTAADLHMQLEKEQEGIVSQPSLPYVMD